VLRLFSVIVFILFITSTFGMLVYMSFMSSEHNLVSSLIFMVFSSVIKCIEFWMLYTFSKFMWLCSNVATCFAGS
jgi:hypothetical protein